MIVLSKCIRAARVVGWVMRVPHTRMAVMGAAMVAFVAAGGGVAWSFPWSIDMFRGPAIQPLEVAPRDMPQGTLPLNGMRPMSLEEMTLKLHNPLKPTAENLAHGKELFNNSCAPCHGDNGNGNGPVAHLLRAHGFEPKNLVTGVAKNLPDGYIYGYIRDGGIHMPSYADAMNSDERWDVVMYVRQLEAEAAKGQKTASK